MDFISQVVLYIIALLIFFGQLARINLFGLNFPLIDILLPLYALLSVARTTKSSLTKSQKLALIFIVYTIFNLVFNLFFRHLWSTIAVLYLVRLISLILILIFPHKLDSRFLRFLHLCIISNIVFGLFQYFFWPDLTYLKAIGWDDHLHRLVSTYFDPTFTGLLYLIYFLWQTTPQPSSLNLLLFLPLALTYSRSSLLSLVFASAYYSLCLKQARVFLISLGLVTISILLLPRKPGEGTKLERTASIVAKTTNTQSGLHSFWQSPLTGIGYNLIPAVQPSNTSHSRGGYDLSLLNFLITNGLIGTLILLSFFIYFFREQSIASQTLLVALFVHSLFANSLFYPQTTVFLALILSSKKV